MPRLFTVLILGFTFAFKAVGQTYDFQSFTVENGLSQAQILSLHQTKTGELWMGTNQGGVNCYNGNTFNYLTTENGLSDNVVYTIKEVDSRILIGTNNGLTVIRGLDTTILGVDNGLPHPGVVSILVSSSNDIWLGTGKGTARLLGDSVIPVVLDSSLSKSTILNIREGVDGSLWFCTVQSGLFKWNGDKMLNISTKDGLERNYVFDAMPLGSVDAWIFGYRGLYHLKGSKLETIDNLPKTLPASTIYYGYARDQASNIWVGTSNGVLKYRDGKFTHLTTENGLVDNNLWKVFQDREGNIWFGSKSSGVSKLTSERFKLYNTDDYLPNKNVTAVYRARDNSLFLGTHRGVAVWQELDTLFFDQRSGVGSEVVSDIDQAPDGTIYIATDYGYSTYRNGKMTPHEEIGEGLQNLNDCRDVFIDGETIWFGTKMGVAKLENGRLKQPFNASQFNGYVFDAIRKDENIWFAYDDGLLTFDGNSFSQLKAAEGFFDGRTRSIALGPNGNLWFGTNQGVYMYNGDSCTNFNVSHGLISDAVYSLAFDSAGSLWVGQSKGLVRFVLDRNEVQDIIQYKKAQGFLGGECHNNSIWTDKNGTVWVGTGNGLVQYDPSMDKGLFYKPKTRITAIKLFSQTTDWTQFADSISSEGIPINAEIPYGMNNVTFEFSGVSLTSAVSMNYSWYLDGFDIDWSPVKHDNKATYTNIPPGKYTFMVRAGFGEELWTNRPISVSFTVLAPFYRTNWFYAICALIIAAIGYSYFTIRTANIQITEQKQKIESQKEEIEKKNRNMVDSINYASTIQSATLPTDDEWFRHLPSSFVLYKPKDIVSGDFYWMTKVGNDVFFAAVDCTGHGVPGALMSIIGYNGLNKAVKELGHTKPNEILHQLSQSVNESLRKAEHDNYVRDGMDISLCKLNLKTRKLEFAGSVNPCLIVRNGEQILLKGDRASIGSLEAAEFEFTNHQTQLKKGDVLFIYSDGYADQFGGTEKKKMKAAVMRSKLVEVAQLDPATQRNELCRYLDEWQGALPQIDDICIIGVKI